MAAGSGAGGTVDGKAAAAGSDSGKAAEHSAASKTSPENELVLKNIAGSTGTAAGSAVGSGGAAKAAEKESKVQSTWLQMPALLKGDCLNAR